MENHICDRSAWPRGWKPLALAAALLLAIVPAHGQGMMGGGMMGQGMMGGERGPMMGAPGGYWPRHRYVMRHGLPAAYAGLTDPLPRSRAVLAHGAQVYADNCASCHGERGLGDGPAGKDLSPPPPAIAATAGMAMPDGFYYWTIAEGGRPFGSAMPAFRGTLSTQEIWSVISYLRAGLPATPGR